MVAAFFDILTVAWLAFGAFFMFVGVIGLVRLPDAYNRMHAASKCITLGIAGVVIAAMCHFGAARVRTSEAPPGVIPVGVTERISSAEMLSVATTSILVILFQFVAAPVGTHMLARAAHAEKAELAPGTLSDDLEIDGQHLSTQEGEGEG